MNAPLMLPRRSRGRQSPEREGRYRAEREAFCRLVLESASMSSMLSWRRDLTARQTQYLQDLVVRCGGRPW
jgi:hypothetical protein